MSDSPPESNLLVRGIVETCINVAEINRAREFYQSLFGFEAMVGDDRFCAFRVGVDVLLLFKHGESKEPIVLPGGVIPPHETSRPGHFAFAISPDELSAWRTRLWERGVEIESEVRWERGGTSLYFRDLDDNLLELATPGIWPNY
jgi:catechol 2,3-dioxygenase-like lactoylglutathione lyase family enzyme